MYRIYYINAHVLYRSHSSSFFLSEPCYGWFIVNGFPFGSYSLSSLTRRTMRLECNAQWKLGKPETSDVIDSLCATCCTSLHELCGVRVCVCHWVRLCRWMNSSISWSENEFLLCYKAEVHMPFISLPYTNIRTRRDESWSLLFIIMNHTERKTTCFVQIVSYLR